MYRYLENTKKRVKCKKILLLLFQRGSLCSFHIEWCSCTFDNSHHNHLFSIKVFCPMTRVYFFFDTDSKLRISPSSCLLLFTFWWNTLIHLLLLISMSLNHFFIAFVAYIFFKSSKVYLLIKDMIIKIFFITVYVIVYEYVLCICWTSLMNVR